MTSLAELGEISKADRKKQDNRHRNANLALAGGGGTLTAVSLGNRMSETVDRARIAGARRQHASFQSHPYRGLDERGMKVDLGRLNPTAQPKLVPVTDPRAPKVDRQGKPIMRKINTRSERDMAAGRWTSREQKLRQAAFRNPKRWKHAHPLMLAGAGTGIGAAWLGARNLAKPNEKVRKDITVKTSGVDRKDVDRAAVGGVAGAAAFQVPSHIENTYIRDRWKKQIDADPRKKRIYDAAKKKHNVVPQVGHRSWIKFYRDYPKELPGWRTRRFMARANAGKSGVAIAGGVAAGTGLAAAAHGRHRDKQKGLR